MFLFTNILPDGCFIVPHRTDAIASGPEMQPCHAFLIQQLAMDFDGTFAFQKSDRVGDTVLGRNAQTQMNVIRHGMTFEQFYSPLLAQLPKYPTNFPAHFAEKDFVPILRDEYDMELTVPFDM
jgi:hypothetical protein